MNKALPFWDTLPQRVSKSFPDLQLSLTPALCGVVNGIIPHWMDGKVRRPKKVSWLVRRHTANESRARRLSSYSLLSLPVWFWRKSGHKTIQQTVGSQDSPAMSLVSMANIPNPPQTHLQEPPRCFAFPASTGGAGVHRAKET